MSDITIIQGGVVPGYSAVPSLWRQYLEKNGVSEPRGLQIESYWVAQPTLARRDGVLPLPSYAFYKDDFHPLFDTATKELGRIINHTTVATAGTHTRAFVNKVGSTTDIVGVEKLYSSAGISHYAWAEIGLDCPPAVCTDVFGNPVPAPHVHAASILAAPINSTLLPPRSWTPLTVAEVMTAVAPMWQ